MKGILTMGQKEADRLSVITQLDNHKYRLL